MSTIKIEDAEGRWALLTGISQEPDNWARITGIKDANEFIDFVAHEHPTCGSFKWSMVRGTELEVRPLSPATRRKK